MSLLSQNSKNDLTQLIDLIESSDSNVADEAALILRDLLNNGDTVAFQCLLEKFLANNSERVLDIICTIREPLDKLLLDKMIELLRTYSQRCLSIFAQLILKNPTWLYKLSVHPFLGQFLKYLKACNNVSFAIGGLFCVSSLLPLLPSMSVHLNDYFTVFITLIELLRLKSDWPQIYQIHVRIALFAFFQRLYALYPCNFLRFLRFYFAGMNKSSPERKNLFDNYLRPMLDHVRLHPLFITSSKDEELSKERWMQKEAHDILVECNAVCVNSGYSDAYDGLLYRPKSLSFTSHSRPQSLISSQKTTPMKNADERSSCSPVSLVPVSLPSDNAEIGNNRNSAEITDVKSHELRPVAENSDEWSPSVAVGLCTPPSSRSDTPSSLFTLSDTSGGLRSNRTESFGGGTSGRSKKQQQETTSKSRNSFGQKIGRLFSKPDSNRYKKQQTSSVPPSPMYKDRENVEFTYPPVNLLGGQSRTMLPCDSSMELAEEASETELNNSRKASFCVESLTVVADISKRISAEDSRHEDIEVAGLTKELSKGDVTSSKSDEQLVKSRHPSSQSCQSRNISRHSSFLDAPQSSNYVENDGATTFYIDSQGDTKDVADLPCFGNNSSTVADVPFVQPRLSTSHSVADFMKRINRYRFNSQCVVVAPLTDNVQPPLDDISSAIAAANDDNRIATDFSQMVQPKIKRPRSCPIKMELSVAAADGVVECATTIAIAPQPTSSRRDSNQPTSILNTADNQTSFTINDRSTTDENVLSLDNGIVLDFPLYKFARMFYPMEEDVRNKNVCSDDYLGVNGYEGFDDYLVNCQLSHDCDYIQKSDKTSSNKMELEHLRTMIVLLRHQLFYERHKRMLHAERNRRLHGRLKQTSALEEQNVAQKDQLRLQEIEIQQLIQALSDARRFNVEAKNDFVNKEAALTNSLQKILKEKAECTTKLESKLRDLKAMIEKNQKLMKELSACKQHLFNATSRLEEYAQETNSNNQTQSSSLSSDLLTREALLVAEINSRLRSKLALCHEYETSVTFLQSKLEEYEKTSKKEVSDLKKSYKKEKNRADAASTKLAEFENHVQKLHQQIGELKRQLEESREVHLEHLKASQMKFRSLVSVCQRQEAHILELYQQLENYSLVATNARSAFESKSSDVQSSSCRGEGLRIPSRQGAKEIMSYDSDVFAGCGSSCGSENMFLPFLFEKRSAQTASRGGGASSVGEPEDEAVYAS